MKMEDPKKALRKYKAIKKALDNQIKSASAKNRVRSARHYLRLPNGKTRFVGANKYKQFIAMTELQREEFLYSLMELDQLRSYERNSPGLVIQSVKDKETNIKNIQALLKRNNIKNEFFESLKTPEQIAQEAIEEKESLKALDDDRQNDILLQNSTQNANLPHESADLIFCDNPVTICQLPIQKVETLSSNTSSFNSNELNEHERYILEQGLTSPALWAAALFPHHVTEAFGSFHHEIFSLLYQQVVPPLVTYGGGGMASDGGENSNLSNPHFFSSFQNVDNLGVEKKRTRKLVIAAPRGHAKTTCVMLFVLWCICYRMRKYVVLVSDTEDQAKMQLDAIKSELEGNELLRRLYGDLVGDVWGQESVQTSSGIRVQCRGAAQKVRGLKFREKRPDLIVCDDILNDELVETEERRQKLRRWFFAALMPALAKDGAVVVVGTLMHESDLLSELLESGAGWEKRRFGARMLNGEPDEKGELLWPEHFGEVDLDEIRMEYEEKGELPIYFREYFNKIVGHGGQLFQRVMFEYLSLEEFKTKFYDEASPSKEELLFEEEEPREKIVSTGNLRTFMTVDPSYTIGKRTDYTAIVVVSLDHKNVWYIRHCYRARLNVPGVVEQIFRLVRMYRPTLVGMQGVDWNRFFKSVLQAEMRKRNEFFNVKELATYSVNTKGLGSKNSRIARLSQYYTSKSIVHIKEAPGIREYESELLAFPNSKFDDLSDAAAMQIDLVFGAPEKRVEKSYYEEEDEQDINSISGY